MTAIVPVPEGCCLVTEAEPELFAHFKALHDAHYSSREKGGFASITVDAEDEAVFPHLRNFHHVWIGLH